MFEGIKHNYSSDGMTVASYTAGDVMGRVSFSTAPDRTGVLSSLGPDAAVRECSSSHWLSSFRNRYKARTREEVSDYETPLTPSRNQ